MLACWYFSGDCHHLIDVTRYIPHWAAIIPMHVMLRHIRVAKNKIRLQSSKKACMNSCISFCF